MDWAIQVMSEMVSWWPLLETFSLPSGVHLGTTQQALIKCPDVPGPVIRAGNVEMNEWLLWSGLYYNDNNLRRTYSIPGIVLNVLYILVHVTFRTTQ